MLQTAPLADTIHSHWYGTQYGSPAGCTATRPSQASPRKAEQTVTPAQDLEAFKADMTSMLSDMLQASLSKFASQFNRSSGGQGDSAPAQTVASEPTVDVASNDDDSPHRGPEDQSEGEVTDTEGEPADPTATGLHTLEQLKMSEEEQREYDAFSLASVSVVPVPVSSTAVRSKHSPSNFYSFGAYGDSIPAPSGDLGGQLVNSPPGPSSFITTSGSAIRYARPCRFHSESKEIRAGPDSGSPVPRNSLTFGPRESFTPGVNVIFIR